MFDEVYLIKSISAVTNYNSSSCLVSDMIVKSLTLKRSLILFGLDNSPWVDNSKGYSCWSIEHLWIELLAIKIRLNINTLQKMPIRKMPIQYWFGLVWVNNILKIKSPWVNNSNNEEIHKRSKIAWFKQCKSENCQSTLK